MLELVGYGMNFDQRERRIDSFGTSFSRLVTGSTIMSLQAKSRRESVK